MQRQVKYTVQVWFPRQRRKNKVELIFMNKVSLVWLAREQPTAEVAALTLCVFACASLSFGVARTNGNEAPTTGKLRI